MSMKWWKALGVAAFVGVAATGVAIARAERERRAYTPEQVRDRLHARVAEVDRAAQRPVGEPEHGAVAPSGPVGALRARLAGFRTWRPRPVATIGRLARRTRKGERDAAKRQSAPLGRERGPSPTLPPRRRGRQAP
ncbi:hypothetical protein BDW27_11328 [Nocardiopsis sp. L17-MgMaSL7]|nr:hypothetical protein BDW27_11328 [Nocardiopsis sp. L17-MgMaSL7]